MTIYIEWKRCDGNDGNDGPGRGGNIRARTPRRISEPCMASAVASQESRTTCYAVDSGEDLSKSKRRESCGDSKESKSFQIGCK